MLFIETLPIASPASCWHNTQHQADFFGWYGIAVLTYVLTYILQYAKMAVYLSTIFTLLMSNLASSTVCSHTISQTFQPLAEVQQPAHLHILVLHSIPKKVCIITYTKDTVYTFYLYLTMKEGKQSSAQYRMSKRNWIKWFKTVLGPVMKCITE